MKHCWLTIRLLLLVLSFSNMTCAQDLIRSGASLRMLSLDFEFTEGPTADPHGNVYFTDQPNDRIMKWSTDGKLTTFLQPSGRSNGLFFTTDGRILACADESNELWSIAPDGSHNVLVRGFQDGKLNGPNDVWARPDGGIYFTDPYYKRNYWTRGPSEQPGMFVYFCRSDGTGLKHVEDGLVQPNGIIGTPDGETLYVADIRDNKTYAYKISKDGGLSDRQLFCHMGSDGMTIDDRGNVYLTGRGVTVFSPSGEQLLTIDVPQRWTANVCFGGQDNKTLFITASKGLFALDMNVSGVR